MIVYLSIGSEGHLKWPVVCVTDFAENGYNIRIGHNQAPEHRRIQPNGEDSGMTTGGKNTTNQSAEFAGVVAGEATKHNTYIA